MRPVVNMVRRHSLVACKDMMPGAGGRRTRAKQARGRGLVMQGRQGDEQVVIMGAGPAGLTAAYELRRYDVPVTVIEKDPRFVGGISRTEQRDGYRFDIGGHRFFSKSQE